MSPPANGACIGLWVGPRSVWAHPSERQDDEEGGKPSLPVRQLLPAAYHGERFGILSRVARSEPLRSTAESP
jgi:hypothetical protein